MRWFKELVLDGHYENPWGIYVDDNLICLYEGETEAREEAKRLEEEGVQPETMVIRRVNDDD